MNVTVLILFILIFVVIMLAVGILQLSYAYDEDSAAVVSEMAEMRKESLESMPDYYSNVTSEELITGDGFAL